MVNKEKFQELLINPDSILPDEMLQLHQVIKDYPYFHDAHLLLLYGLHKLKSDKFEDQLKQSALYLASRTTLANAIMQGWSRSSSPFKPEVTGLLETKFSGTSEVEELQIIDDPEKEIEISTKTILESESVNVVDDEVAREVTFDDNFSFSLEDSQPIEELNVENAEVLGKREVSADLLEFDLTSKVDEGPTEDLIDHFLKVNPRIVPKLDLEDVRGDISIPGLEENDEIVTETLADIYEQQGHFLKAKEAYQKLILKFPEKSTYFASRIQKLENRIK